MRGLNVGWDGDGYSLRVGHVEGKPDIGNIVLPGYIQASSCWRTCW